MHSSPPVATQYTMPYNLKGKNVLVTGGSRGLGAVICQKFAAEGCNVAINYHSSRAVAEDLASRLAKEYSIKSIVLQGDAELPEDNQRVVQEANEQLSGLDIVIANAGWTRFANQRDIYDLSFEEWDKASYRLAVLVRDANCMQGWRVNVMSHLQLMQAAKPIFEKNVDGGVYIMTSSIAGITTDGSSMGYSVSKAAALHLMKHLALSVGPKIRVNAVLPGLMLTEWGKKFGDSAIEWLNQKAILKQEVMLLSSTDLEDCANMFVTLAKNTSMTGQQIVIDSGLAMGRASPSK
ncbi:granaticin polyketide synthase putative ketoacyl reductase 2 [Aspergillus udagawae]|uniref:Granaticin polyketide synthase putative ketoacyl reductase 2 n=1 Tax=Aspergillus udagawae TaxID=91492 RepID=A0A8H3S1Q7_9EURO|nr:granaticin polyketide synthase putative ketoacyl reductase 2 [Aspergillus udagawae]